MKTTRLTRLLITVHAMRRCCAACLRYGRAASHTASFIDAARLRDDIAHVEAQVARMLRRLILPA